ncbi:MAG TPA: carbohydrate kinase family protein [Kaistia sp.]|nr:carbohydrate kinase family protein [Kaistia sp.]
MAASTLLFVGDVSLDLTMAVSHVPQPDEKVHADRTVEGPGGVVANAAAAAAASGAAVRLSVRLGNDTASEVLLAGLRAAGLEVEVEHGDSSVYRVVVLIEPHGEKRLMLDPNPTLFPTLDAIERLSMDGVAHVHTALYGPAAPRLVERCREAGVPWSLDLEPATFKEGFDTIAPLVAGASVVFVNERSARAIGDGFEQILLRTGAKSVIHTMGAEGARYCSEAATFTVAPPSGLAVIDTTGAGDCLAGWFVAGLAAGLPPQESLRRAVVAASLSCGRLGGQMSFPDRAAVLSLLQIVESAA